jgi:hypothetical protein
LNEWAKLLCCHANLGVPVDVKLEDFTQTRVEHLKTCIVELVQLLHKKLCVATKLITSTE